MKRGDNFVFDHLLASTITKCINEKPISQKRRLQWGGYQVGDIVCQLIYGDKNT